MIEDDFGKDRSTGVAGAQKKKIHGITLGEYATSAMGR
jgi:hypothetical protein